VWEEEEHQEQQMKISLVEYGIIPFKEKRYRISSGELCH